ncbi:ATP-binding protein [Pseudogemmobacter bohemicus]|uniref:ATP-binding protein n=1 Tax=Pseudogemmobacter bohemicus TaxID=2250708 RepID=UPI002FCDB7F2
MGSASIKLLRQSGETLAGRIAYAELAPLDANEVPAADLDKLWLRGGFPDSFLAKGDQASLRWRRDFIRTYLERDIPALGPRIAAETLRRFWTMLAHRQSSLSNGSELARALGVDGKTVASYLDLLVDLMLVRRLEPWHTNTGKRLVKSPRIYVRDTGILHALLGLTTLDDVLGHPVAGASWEGLVIETAHATMPVGTQAQFYRSGAGAEVDLVLTLPGGAVWAIEVKRSLAPKVERGFHSACEDLKPARRIVIYPGTEAFPLQNGIEVMSLHQLGQDLLAQD